MVRFGRWFAAVAVGVVAVPLAVAQQRSRTPKAPELDPQIVAAVKEVSPARVKATIEKLVSFYNRSTLSPADTASIAKGRGIGAAREWILSEFARYSKECDGCLKLEMQSFTVSPPARRIPQPTEIVNVVATMPGADPANAGRIYLVSGHYDSRNSDNDNVTDPAPGANDDASGTAVSLECARVLSKHKFPATIIVSGRGRRGAGTATAARISPKTAKAAKLDIEGVLNNDIVGGNRTPGDTHAAAAVGAGFLGRDSGRCDVRTRSSSSAPRAWRTIRPHANWRAMSAGRRSNICAGVSSPCWCLGRDRYLRGGDHLSFNEQGFAAVRFTEFRENYNHQHQTSRTEKGVEYGDLPKFVDFDYVANVARLERRHAGVAGLGSGAADQRSPGDQTLENDSTLEWNASPGGLATRYEVLWRRRPTPIGLRSMCEAVGNVTQATLARSKDNVIFAVRALDAKGHRSAGAVVPLNRNGVAYFELRRHGCAGAR